MRLLVSNSSTETGALLEKYLRARGFSGKDATVCYGLPTDQKPALNANCGIDKVKRMAVMEKAGVSLIPWFYKLDPVPKDLRFPLLARKAQGHGGTDIVPVFQREEIPWRVKAGWDWFSQYIPVAAEHRVWVFRGQHLDTYQKVMKRPEQYCFLGRNYRNGFDFELLDLKSPHQSFIESRVAIAALKLDFAAVDCLVGQDGKTYVLETNTAPGVLRSHAEATLGKLADKIVEWAQKGYPERV